MPCFSLLDGPSKITEELLEETYEKLRVSADQQPEDGNGGDELDSSNYLKLINAFDMPLWRWEDSRGGFEKYIQFYHFLFVF